MMSQKKNKRLTILVMGASSSLGSSLCQHLSKTHRVIGTYYKTPIHIKNVTTLKCNVLDKESVQILMYWTKPDLTLYCVGMNNLTQCELFPKKADALNSMGVYNAANISERYQSKFIFFSSAYVFSGEDTLYLESDTPVPTSLFGSTLSTSEFFIQKTCLNYIIFRLSRLIMRGVNPQSLSLIEKIEQSIESRSELKLDHYVENGFLSINQLSHFINKAINSNITNKLIHIDSQNHMTTYDFAKTYCELAGHSSSHILQDNWKFPRSKNFRSTQHIGAKMSFKLSTDNMENLLNVTTPTIEDSIKRYLSNYKDIQQTKSKLGTSQTEFI